MYVARSPNLNAYAERWVRSVKEECLCKVILFGERSLAASVERIYRTFPCRTESPREGQCPAVPSECKHPPRHGAQTETKSGTMRIKDVRQGLHTLLHTQGLDGLLHLYKRLEKRGRALLLCLLCVEAGWLILVNAWLQVERAYLKLRLFLRV